MLYKQKYFIKEHVGMLKFSNTYDIIDPETQEKLGIAKEKPGAIIQILRLLIDKHFLPTKIDISEEENQPPLLTITRGFVLFRSKIEVVDGNGKRIGYFKSKLLSLGGGFFVYDNSDAQVAEIKGDWKGWNFQFLDNHGREIGTVTKKWGGIGKELFTSADNYMVSIDESVSGGGGLLLAAGLAIDTVFKE